MASFSVSSRGFAAVEVVAPNWIAALGHGLQELGRAEGLERLACEVLPNGTVIARDITSGTGYVVQNVSTEAEAPEELELVDIEPLTDEATRGTGSTAPEPGNLAGDLLDAILDADSPASAASLALTLARESVPAESGAVILEDRGYLRFVSVVGPHSRRLIGVRLPLGTGVAGFAMQKQRIVVLDDAREDPRHCGEVDALTGYVTQQIAVIPVRKQIDGEEICFGVLELMNLPRGERFDNERITRLKGVADALASRLASA